LIDLLQRIAGGNHTADDIKRLQRGLSTYLHGSGLSLEQALGIRSDWRRVERDKLLNELISWNKNDLVSAARQIAQYEFMRLA
jgi:hypothetical protein